MSFTTDPGFRTEPAIGADRTTVFVSLELSRSKSRWCTNIPGVVELSHASRGGRLQDAVAERRASAGVTERW